jgi:hypothetical protein
MPTWWPSRTTRTRSTRTVARMEARGKPDVPSAVHFNLETHILTVDRAVYADDAAPTVAFVVAMLGSAQRGQGRAPLSGLASIRLDSQNRAARVVGVAHDRCSVTGSRFRGLCLRVSGRKPSKSHGPVVIIWWATVAQHHLHPPPRHNRPRTAAHDAQQPVAHVAGDSRTRISSAIRCSWGKSGTDPRA